ncbi:EamA family transporter [Clostridium tetani]|uniref:DMT family transporter n=1 Tax=Clostridium tetani TaxID=1513 RepID=UPI00100A48C5|nr:DMT family transporter [Clostridium tetani]RXI49720.1 EamA family transporter [Clostridium tetani]
MIKIEQINLEKSKGRAVAFMLLSSFCFAVMAALVKLSGDVPSIEKAFFRNFVSLIVSIYIILKNKQKPWGKKENRKYLILRGIMGTAGLVCYFYCIDNMILADSSMLNKMHPFFTIIFAVIFLKEDISLIQIFSLILSFLGALFIIKPKFDMSVIPALIGVVSAVFAGAAYTLVRHLGDKEKSYTIVFYFSLISVISILPFMILTYKPLNLFQFIALLMAGIFASIAQYSLTYAYKIVAASEISIYNYTNVIFSQIKAFIIWKELPDIYSFIGYVLIIGSSYITYKYMKKRN